MVFPHFSYFNGKGGICVTSKDINIMIDNLRYALDDVDLIMRGVVNDYLKKGYNLSLMRLHAVCIRIGDLIEALNNLTVDEKAIIGG